jgi:hypothetical protein
MDTYTALKSLGGILGLIAFVALLSFYEDIIKWAQSQMKQSRRNLRKSRNRTYRLANTAKRPQLNCDLFQEHEDSLFMKPSGKTANLSEPILEDHQELA